MSGEKNTALTALSLGLLCLVVILSALAVGCQTTAEGSGSSWTFTLGSPFIAKWEQNTEINPDGEAKHETTVRLLPDLVPE